MVPKRGAGRSQSPPLPLQVPHGTQTHPQKHILLVCIPFLLAPRRDNVNAGVATTTTTTPPPTPTTPTSIPPTSTQPPLTTTSPRVTTDEDGQVYTTVVIVSATPSTSSAAPTNTSDSSSSSPGKGTFIGLGVAGGIAVLGLAGFLVWKFTQKRFSQFDDDGEKLVVAAYR
jgi:hypothetical protein